MLMDLHVHTTASDGEYTPKEVVEMAKEIGIGVLAVTDHDTIGGLAEALEWGERSSLTVVPGIEINAEYDEELHILGYGFQYDHPSVEATCKWLYTGREERGKRIIVWLNERGVALTLDEVRAYAKGKQLGRPHFARALVDKGYAASMEEAFDHYLSGDDFDKIDREKMTAQAAIELITQAGGIAVLAHPSSLKLDAVALEDFVCHLQNYGLRGMECYYSANTAEWTQTCLAIAERRGLLVTGGTDFHGGMTKRGIKLGSGRGEMHFWSDEVLRVLRQETYWGQKNEKF